MQGVGFRPFVYRLACKLHLHGYVQNEAGGVRIEVEGSDAEVSRFHQELVASVPASGRIDRVEVERIRPRGATGFEIRESRCDITGGAAHECLSVGPDRATCATCLEEMSRSGDRRAAYPFINCTECGPRWTIVEALPYDRGRTTMAIFPMCRICAKEYRDPSDRRYHAEPTACAECGPTLRLLDGHEAVDTEDPIAGFAQALLRGEIGMLKGLGGFHLVCDATDEASVRSIRERKSRDEKPLAVMVQDLRNAARFCEIDACAGSLLESAARPIVLVPRKASARVAAAVAPDTRWLGLMLPYTPLHVLLMERVHGRPLVVTSANRAGHPIAQTEEQATSFADLRVLTHNRRIASRCEDSVVRPTSGGGVLLRFGRGYAPTTFELPWTLRCPTVALGGQWKSGFAIGHGRHVSVGPYQGNLGTVERVRGYAEALGHFEGLHPSASRLVHDMHPDYWTTEYAHRRRRVSPTLALLGVQHHHAHMASVMVEHGLVGPALGVCFDGTGFGLDGCVWGGEFLLGDCATVERVAHLRYTAMPGGDLAAVQPWRMAVAHLAAAGLPDHPVSGVGALEHRQVLMQIASGIHAPMTSSLGRLFDAVAAILGLCHRQSYEAQAAMRLESLADSVPAEEGTPFAVADAPWPLIADPSPMLLALVKDVARGVAPARLARRFHASVAEMVVDVCRRIRERTGVTRVVLAGGVFCNALLSDEVTVRLEREGFHPYGARRLPPNDGGLCLGQLAVAAASDSPRKR